MRVVFGRYSATLAQVIINLNEFTPLSPQQYDDDPSFLHISVVYLV